MSDVDDRNHCSTGRVLVVPLRRARPERVPKNSDTRNSVLPEAKPSRAAQMLALAHELQRLIDSREVADRATLAEQLGLTRARLTQILDLLLLAPDIQEDVLLCVAPSGGRQVTERLLRRAANRPSWTSQRLIWHTALERLP